MTNNIIKVTPGSRGNFSKLRKYKSGGELPKFENPATPIALWYSLRYANNSALKNWNKSLDKSKAGATIYGGTGSGLHGNAGDLQYAWLSNLAYTSNRDLIRSDIQYWFDKWIQDNPNATKEQAVEAYNSIAAQIRAYQTLGHSYNDKGATTNNRNFRSLFNSRSNKEADEDKSSDNSFIGYLDAIEDYYGSSSFLRRMDQYEKEFDQLTDEEKEDRLHTINWGDKTFKVYKKANGDIALLPDDGTVPPPGDDPNNPGGGSGTNEDGTEENDPNQPGGPHLILTYDNYPGPTHTPWTDWLPLSHLLTNDLINSKYQYDLDILKKFPLSQPPRREAVVTDDYAGRQTRQGLAAEVRSRANRNLTSSAITNLQIQDAAENLAALYEGLNALALTELFNNTTKAARDVADWNNLQAREVANSNLAMNAASFNNILEARLKRATRDNASKNSYIANMYTSHGQWLLNQRMEDARYDKAIKDYEYQQELANLYQTSGLKALENGISGSQAFLSFKAIVSGDTSKVSQDVINKYRNLQGLKDTSDTGLINWLNTPNTGEEELFRLQIQNAFKTEQTEAQNRYNNASIEALARYLKGLIGTPDTFSNQGIYWNPSRWYSYAPLPQVRSAQKGTRLERFVDYMEHYRKSLKMVLDNNLKTLKLIQDRLKRDLGALDDETKILLKYAFK